MQVLEGTRSKIGCPNERKSTFFVRVGGLAPNVQSLIFQSGKNNKLDHFNQKFEFIPKRSSLQRNTKSKKYSQKLIQIIAAHFCGHLCTSFKNEFLTNFWQPSNFNKIAQSYL